MSVFRAVSRVIGKVSPLVEDFVAQGLDELVSALLVSALATWRESGFVRFDDLEINCTVQVYRCALLAQDADSSLRILRVQLEWVQATPEMLSAQASASSMKRPDLRVSVGRSAARTVECKRLKLSDGLPKAYVDEGLARFVSGAYGGEEGTGAMIGYVQADEPREVVEAVNSSVAAHPSMDATHQLQPQSQAEQRLSRYRSTHVRVGRGPIEVEHHHADLRDSTSA